jgi:hypothetical protein
MAEVDKAEQAEVSIEAKEEEDSKETKLQTSRDEVLSPWNRDRQIESYI